MQYRYVGYTLQGGLFKGRVKADNQAEACGEIADYGYKLLEVSRCRQFPGMEQLFPSSWPPWLEAAAVCNGLWSCSKWKAAIESCGASSRPSSKLSTREAVSLPPWGPALQCVRPPLR